MAFILKRIIDRAAALHCIPEEWVILRKRLHPEPVVRASDLTPQRIPQMIGHDFDKIDIRFPVTMTSKQVIRGMQDHLEDEGGYVDIKFGGEPLFYSPDSVLVSNLLAAYQTVTGDMETQPMTIGGGTYAKGIHNTIAFGCAFPNRDYHIHDANEFVDIDELLLQAEIYAQAIINLLNA